MQVIFKVTGKVREAHLMVDCEGLEQALEVLTRLRQQYEAAEMLIVAPHIPHYGFAEFMNEPIHQPLINKSHVDGTPMRREQLYATGKGQRRVTIPED